MVQTPWHWRRWLAGQLERLVGWLYGDAAEEHVFEFAQPPAGRIEIWLEIDEEVYRWLMCESANTPSNVAQLTEELLGERIDQIRAGRLGLGDNVEVVQRWRCVSARLWALDHAANESLETLGYRVPWSDVAVLDSLLLESQADGAV